MSGLMDTELTARPAEGSSILVELLRTDNDNVIDLETSQEEEKDEATAPSTSPEVKKEEGNRLYRQQNYPEAIKLYTEAIELSPNTSAYYGNRCACYLMLGDYKLALLDARKSVELDQGFVKGYVREIKCLVALGDTESAHRTIEKVKALNLQNAEIEKEAETVNRALKLQQDFTDSFQKQDYRSALFYTRQALSISPQSVRMKLAQAETQVYLAQLHEAQKIADEVLRADMTNADAVYVKGIILYYQDNTEKAFLHFQHALRLAPDHTKAKEIYKRAKLLKSKKEEGNIAYTKNELEKAYEIYSFALTIDPLNTSTNAKLYFNRAVVNAKRKKIKEAIDDCTSAIKLDETYLKAYLKRAKLYSDSEMYEEAVRDYEAVYQREKTREFKALLDNAKTALKKSQRKDYYKILGVNKTATDDDIKKAYKKRALLHHPDRHADASDEVKREQEKKFKELGEAYSVLTDSKKRTRYDSGLDLDGSTGYADFDPNIFSFFANAPNTNSFGNGFQSFSFQQGGFSQQGYNPFHQYF